MIVSCVGVGGVGWVQICDGGGFIGVTEGVADDVIAWGSRRKGEIFQFQGIIGASGPCFEIGLLHTYGAVNLVQGK